MRRAGARALAAGCLAVVLLVVCSRPVYAQNTYAARVRLADTLNEAMEKFLDTAVTEVLITAAQVGTLSLKNALGGCLSISSDPVIRVARAGQYVVLSVQIAEATAIEIPPDTHPLVCDLQLAWLKRSWGKVIQDSVGDRRIGSGHPCLVGSDFQQAYFMGALLDIETGSDARDSLKKWFAEERIQGAGYMVIPPGESEELHDTVVAFTHPPSLDYDVVYLAQRHDGVGGRDTAYAKMAYTRATFDQDLLLTTGQVVLWVEIEAGTRKYLPADCSPQYNGNDLVNTDSAYVRVSYRVKDYGSAGVETTEHIWRKFATADINQDNADLWQFFDEEYQWELDQWCEFNIDSDGYLVFKALAGGTHQCTAPGEYRIMRLRDTAAAAQTCEFTCFPASTFQVRGMTGELVCSYNDPQYPTPEVVPCLEFCALLAGYRTVDKVVAASAQRFDNAWPYDTAQFLRAKVLNTWPGENTSNTVYETGQATWRPAEAVAYRTRTRAGGKLASTSERVYKDAGIFVDDNDSSAGAFRLYDWRAPDADTATKWLSAGVATLFSPFGQPLEERDILGIYSAAKFAHRNTVPRLIAKNARYNAVEYESFEDGRGNVDTTAHSGRWSLRLPSSFPGDEVLKLEVDTQMRTKGVLLRLWVRRTYHSYHDTDIAVAIDSGFGTGAFVKVAQTGAWTLYERVCNVSSITAGTDIELKLKDNLPSDTVWIDDVRAQPYDAEMICHAYDPNTLRLLASFDDQHFAAFYQYNSEGKLVRRLRETERGVKTVAETQYHLPDMSNRDGSPASSAMYGGSGGMARAAFGGSGGDGSERAEGDGASQGKGSRVDLLDASLGVEGFDWKLFGGRSIDLSRLNIDSLRSALGLDTSAFAHERIEVLKDAGFDDLERVRDVIEARRLEQRMKEITEHAKEEVGEEERRRLVDELAVLAERRRQLMRDRLGVDENGLRELYRSLEEAEHNDDGR